MSQTVDELRNEIRDAVGRYERIESTAFTKEALAAISEAVGHEVDTDRLPAKGEMRAGILRNIGHEGADEADTLGRPFRKAELEAIASAVLAE